MDSLATILSTGSSFDVDSDLTVYRVKFWSPQHGRSPALLREAHLRYTSVDGDAVCAPPKPNST